MNAYSINLKHVNVSYRQQLFHWLNLGQIRLVLALSPHHTLKTFGKQPQRCLLSYSTICYHIHYRTAYYSCQILLGFGIETVIHAPLRHLQLCAIRQNEVCVYNRRRTGGSSRSEDLFAERRIYGHRLRDRRSRWRHVESAARRTWRQVQPRDANESESIYGCVLRSCLDLRRFLEPYKCTIIACQCSHVSESLAGWAVFGPVCSEVWGRLESHV